MITERRLALREEERHYVGVAPKVKRREQNRERKALVAAKIEKAIEKELMDRLKSGAYGDKPLNVDEKVWKKIMGQMEEENSQDEEEDWDEEDWDEEEESDDGEVEYVADDGEGEYVDVDDLEKWLADSDREASSASESESDSDSDEENKNSAKRRKKGTSAKTTRPKVEIEYEEEHEVQNAEQEVAQ